MKTSPIFLTTTFIICIGCNKKADQLDHHWTIPTRITQSLEGLGGRVALLNFQSSIIGLQPLNSGMAQCFLLNQDHKSWFEVSLANVPGNHNWTYPLIEESSGSILFPECLTKGDQLVINIFSTSMGANGEFRVQGQTEWSADKRAFFLDARPNMHLNDPGRPGPVGSGPGVVSGSEIYVPYSVDAKEITYRGKTLFVDGSNGPFNDGVLHSTDSGRTWQIERIADFQGMSSAVCKSKGYYYYFVTRMVTDQGFQLWFSRKPDNGSWDAPKVLTKTFANAFGHFVAVSEDDTVHLGWMDRRHEKKRFNLMYPDRQNWEVVYCQRKDSDTNWSKEIILSKGLLYSYWPSMSVEGDKIVVAWWGIRTAKDWHSFNDPNDIYYVTSKDGGKNWTGPLKITDGAKDGITSGEPQTVLLNGVIHLFYTQGKMNLKEESPGLTKLNQAPWPIYYRQRPFPN